MGRLKEKELDQALLELIQEGLVVDSGLRDEHGEIRWTLTEKGKERAEMLHMATQKEGNA